MKNYVSLFDNCLFAFDGKDSILEEKDIGICADISSIQTPDCSVFALRNHQGCPYTNTAFTFDVRIGGEAVNCHEWKWLPNAILRRGQTKSLLLETVTAVIPGTRGAIQKVTVTPRDTVTRTLPLAVMFRGKTRHESDWQFCIPTPESLTRVRYSDEEGILSYAENGCAFRITASLAGMRLFSRAYLWENEITLSGEPVTFYFSVQMGDEKDSLMEAQNTVTRYEEELARSFDYLENEVARIHNMLPRFSSNVPELDRLYYRSLVTYILCRWENPDL